MTLDQVGDASEVLSWFCEQAKENAPEGEARASMCLALDLARSYLVEYQRHVVVGGLSGLDALTATIDGELDVSGHIQKYRKSLN